MIISANCNCYYIKQHAYGINYINCIDIKTLYCSTLLSMHGLQESTLCIRTDIMHMIACMQIARELEVEYMFHNAQLREILMRSVAAHTCYALQ